MGGIQRWHINRSGCSSGCDSAFARGHSSKLQDTCPGTKSACVCRAKRRLPARAEGVCASAGYGEPRAGAMKVQVLMLALNTVHNPEATTVENLVPENMAIWVPFCRSPPHF